MTQSGARSIYVVMLWQERTSLPGEPAVWRFSLEDARTGQKHTFGSLDQMVAFLQDRMCASEHTEPLA